MTTAQTLSLPPSGERVCVCGCNKGFVPIRSDQIYYTKTHRPGYRNHKTPAIEKPFRAWDGEGFDRKYVLLANSDDEYVYKHHGLSTEDCFRFLTRKRSSANNVWFGMSYDVNMMLIDVPWHRLRRLKDTGACFYGEFFIRYIPRKFFTVTDKSTGVSFHSYDVWGFFQASFIGSLDNWKIPYSESMEVGKRERDNFSAWRKRALIDYNAEECQKLIRLMDSLRNAISSAGWGINRWDGAGALASWFLNEHKVTNHIRDLGIDDALSHAYFGGRIDSYGWGSVDEIHHYDIVSAYPSAMCECPSLDSLRAIRSSSAVDEPFSLQHIRWNHKEVDRHYAFPFRTTEGTILYPQSGEGWYWTIEIDAAQRRFGKNLTIKRVESIAFSGEKTYPLRTPIEDAFAFRKQLKAQGLASNIPIKLALNSLYGKTAQKKGWGTKPPRYRSLAWASYLTAATRAKLQDAMHGDVVCTMTDAVWSKEKLDLDIGNELGKWDTDDETVPFALVTPGVYQAGEHLYTRGFERSLFDDGGVSGICKRFAGGETAIPYELRRFVGLSLAMMGGSWPDKWREFVPMQRALQNPEYFGTTKRKPWDGRKRRAKFRELESYESSGMSAPYNSRTVTQEQSLLEDRAADIDSEGDD